MLLQNQNIKKLIDEDEIIVENCNVDDQLKSVGLELRIGSDYMRPEIEEVYNSNNGQIELNPRTFYKAHTIENLELPTDIVAHVNVRSSLSREGIIVTKGKVNPGFKGKLVFGIRNVTEKTAYIDVGHPVMELTFFKLDSDTELPYNEREFAQYQGQEGI